MLKIGIIGYGSRISGMAKSLAVFDIPYKVVAISDPSAEEIQKSRDALVKNAAFYETTDDLLDQAEVDGVMVGTRCYLHAEMACKVAARNIPLFLEKPVAITFEQVKRLEETFAMMTAPTVVSFPLRLSPIVQRVKEIVDSGTVGTIEHVVAFNDVPYGGVYYHKWYRIQAGGWALPAKGHPRPGLYLLLAGTTTEVDLCDEGAAGVWWKQAL